MFYLSGKITDVSKEKEKVNIQNFFNVEKELVGRGFEVFNPASLEEEGRSWEWYLARDLKWINDNRPTLYMLPGWEVSRGARLEVEYARLIGLRIVYPI